MGIIQGIKRFFGAQDSTSERPDNPAVYSVLNLQRSKASSDLLEANRQVVLYYEPFQSAREYYHDFMHPESHWTEEEKVILRKKRKAAVAFSLMKAPERTYIGALIQNKYDIKPAPREPSDQNLADVYSALYHYTAFNNSVSIRDIDMIRESWIGGNSWQESFVEQAPGRPPNINVRNQNNFGIYPDPNRRDLVTNYDCRFIDRVGFYSMDDLITIFPEKEVEIRNSLVSPDSIYYERDKPWADRQHEVFEQKNGRYKVVERFYKVSKRLYYGVSPEGEREDIGFDLDIEKRGEYKNENPNHQLFNEPEEYLFLAVACTGVGDYLYNGPYHCQPRDAVTKKIMFTLTELIDEDIGGVPSGHVEHMVGPNKIVDSLMVNTLAQAKNASGVSRVGNPNAFDEAGQRDIEQNVSDGDRVFWKKKDSQVAGSGLEIVPQGTLTTDTSKGVEFAVNNIQDTSSTPPSLQGVSEGSGTPASLNEQRIQQASVQSQVQVSNYKSFLTQRAKLWMYYWNEYFTAEQVIRIVQKKEPEGDDYMVINQLIQDEFGQVQRVNYLQDADAYDIVFEESVQSPTMRDKTAKKVAELLQTGAVQGDPVLNTYLVYYFLELSDAPQDLKKLVKDRSQVIQAEQAKTAQLEQQNAQLAQMGEMQKIADTETQAAFAPGQQPQTPAMKVAA